MLEQAMTASDELPDPTAAAPAPWRAEGEALVTHLLQRGAFTAEEWAAALADESVGAEPDFPAWVRAVRRLMAGPDASEG